ncbi:MAG TPA: PocR ligand-binding domain-containing protein [Prolixibacteraceae bacterium]|nr:PocR ligand-binding domain-containing protein [Prolixibacteraceae bacterium]
MNTSDLTIRKPTTERQSFEVELSNFNFKTVNKTASELEKILIMPDVLGFMKIFFASSSLGVSIFDRNKKQIAQFGWQKICTDFHFKNSETNKMCNESEKYFFKHFKPNKAISYKCKNGLWDISYPLYRNKTFLGYVTFGQFFYSSDHIDKTFFLDRAKRFNFDTEAYIERLKEVPILDALKLEAHVTLFLKMLDKLSS